SLTGVSSSLITVACTQGDLQPESPAAAARARHPVPMMRTPLFVTMAFSLSSGSARDRAAGGVLPRRHYRVTGNRRRVGFGGSQQFAANEPADGGLGRTLRYADGLGEFLIADLNARASSRLC